MVDKFAKKKYRISFFALVFPCYATYLHLHPRTFAVAPEISPFSFPVTAGQAGAFAQVICVVVTGDTPLDISWLYNGASDLPLGTMIQPLGDRTSILTISSVSWFHSGDYECLVQNGAGKASFVGELAVQGTKKLCYAFWH